MREKFGSAIGLDSRIRLRQDFPGRAGQDREAEAGPRHRHRRHHVDDLAGRLGHQARRMEAGVDNRPDAGVGVHQNEGVLGERRRPDAFRAPDRMSLGIDDVQTIDRLEDRLDVRRHDRAAHHAEVDALGLNEFQHPARDHVLEVERHVRPPLAKPPDRLRKRARGNRRQCRQSDDAARLRGDIARGPESRLEILHRSFKRRHEVARHAR